MPPKQFGLIQTHVGTQAVSLAQPLPVPGEFATFKETGGYDSQKDPVVAGIQILGRLTMGLAGNNSKRVELAIEADPAALERQALQGIGAAQQAAIAAIQ